MHQLYKSACTLPPVPVHLSSLVLHGFSKTKMIQFVVVNSASLGVSLIGLKIFMKDNSMNPFLAKIFSMVLAQVVNFVGYRFWVFGGGEESEHLAKRIV